MNPINPKITPSFTRTLGLGMAVAASMASAPMARAAVAITNGDFEDVTGFVAAEGDAANGTSAVITGWYSVTTGGFFENTWHDTRDNDVPTDGASGYAGQGASAFSGIAGNGTTGLNGSWIYQGIGTAELSLTALAVQLDWGDFQGIPGGLRDLGLTVSLFEGDGTFVAANNIDVNGAAGSTLLSSFSLTLPATDGPSKLSIGDGGVLSLAAYQGGELFLRINNWEAGTEDPWLQVDNVSIVPVPEPSIALLGGLGVLGLLRRRRA